jgi:hypothetical protein
MVVLHMRVQRRMHTGEREQRLGVEIRCDVRESLVWRCEQEGESMFAIEGFIADKLCTVSF